MKKTLLLFLLISALFTTHAQNLNDYRSKASGSFTDFSVWERYNGSAWVNAASYPDATAGEIHVRSNHTLSISSPIGLDELFIDSGAILNQDHFVAINSGGKSGLEINGTWNVKASELNGNGIIIVNGIMNLSSGNFGGYNVLTKITFNHGSTFIISGTSVKSAVRTQIFNYGTIDWQAGNLYLNSNVDTSRLINYNKLIYTNGGTYLVGNNGEFINYDSGKIIKNSAGENGYQQGIRYKNLGLIHLSSGTFSTNNQNSSFHNYGTLKIDSPAIFLAAWNVNLYDGTLLTGNGIFNSTGSVFLDGKVTSDTSLNINLTSGKLGGPGSLELFGKLYWTGGTMGGWNVLSTLNVNRDAFLEIRSSNQVSLNRCILNNRGKISHVSTNLSIERNQDSAKLINYNEYYFDAGAADLIGNQGLFLNMPTGKVLKTSSGTNTLRQGLKFENWGLIDLNSGTFSTNNQNSSFHNYGTLKIDSPAIFLAAWNVNLYDGTLLTGNGIFNSTGSVFLDGKVTSDTSLNFNLTNGKLGGPGSLELFGKLYWTGGTMGGWNVLSTINVNRDAFLEIRSSNQVSLNRCILNNRGKISHVSTNLSIERNQDSAKLINYNEYYFDAGAADLIGNQGLFLNMPTGKVLKTSSGTNTLRQGLKFENWGLIDLNSGTFSTNNQNSSFHNYGTLKIDSPAVFLAAWNVNLYDNSKITGNGLLQMTINTTITGKVEADSGINVLAEGSIYGNQGSFIIKGKMVWQRSYIGGNPQFTLEIAENAELILDGNYDKYLDRSRINNFGKVTFKSGTFSIGTNKSPDYAELHNYGVFETTSSGLVFQSNSKGYIINEIPGIFRNNSSGNNSFGATISFNNYGTFEGTGSISFGQNSEFKNSGTISPGFLPNSSPASIGIHGKEPFSKQSILNIELENRNGEGIGHDVLLCNNDVHLSGILKAVETGLIPDSIYVILRTNTASVSGDFDSIILPPHYAVFKTSNTVYLKKKPLKNAFLLDTLCKNGFINFNGLNIDSAGVYTEMFVNDDYDSIVRLTVIKADIPVSVTQNGKVLSAPVGPFTYQWLDCNNGNSTISGENGQTYTPAQSGSYSVEVRNGKCRDTSLCILVDLGNTKSLTSAGIKIFPNPVNDMLNILTSFREEYTLKVYGFDSKLIMDKKVMHENNSILELGGLESGIYRLEIESPDAVFQFKFMKE
ncbi:MAG: T9SS type A sorting domain-containing protein [Flavobacteriales bacterium]|nr:T9SS type A sorting domain-containing protein [Flavobacteriales bacterium]